jgi:penicillin-binding protein 1C
MEALRALQFEIRFSKREILAAYLSFLPFGRNVEGLPAACWSYFGHSPQELTAEEIAVLLAVPQRPARRFPTADNVSYLRAARDQIATWLVEHGALVDGGLGAEATLSRVRAASVPRSIRPLPRHAPHAAYWLVSQLRSTAQHSRTSTSRVVTTLDRGTQLTAERMLGRARRQLEHQGIHNGSVVVVDHHSSAVKALVGNFDFWDAEHGGQIAGFNRARSPGSALKPFIYALALDRGVALPAHLVPDIPLNYSDYSPRNYDGRFTGLVGLEDALSHSLNIPFVRLLGQVGVERFLGTLSAAGVRSLIDRPGYYGLSAAIGALELTPLELAGLYATLAQDGHYRSLYWLSEDAPAGLRTSSGTALFSPGAAFLTRRALARRDRPDFPRRRQLSGAPPRVHWKTGTSYGHRDAWAAGSGPRHSAVVWLGNFDNRSSIDLVGADAAGPILFDLLEALEDRTLPRVAEFPPADLKRVEVCAYSGHLPTPSCGQREWTLALRRRVPTATCPYHVAVDVDLETGLALNPSCRGGRRFERRKYLVYPASIRRWLVRGHRWLAAPPSLAPGCETTGVRHRPIIVSPPSGQVLVLVPGMLASDQEVPLQAESTHPGATLSWFIDGEFFATVDAVERVWWEPSPGWHEIVVVDDAGLSSRRRLEVRARAQAPLQM